MSPRGTNTSRHQHAAFAAPSSRSDRGAGAGLALSSVSGGLLIDLLYDAHGERRAATQGHFETALRSSTNPRSGRRVSSSLSMSLSGAVTS